MNAAGNPGRAPVAIGVDVGGTKCSAGIVAFPDGSVTERRQQPTSPKRGGEVVLADVIELIRSLQHEAARLVIQPIAIGVGVAELVSPSGEILSDATIAWRGLAVGTKIQEAAGLPVHIDADVRAAACAEAAFGAGRELRSFVYVTVGTGISASFMIDGKPYIGARGLTGTFASAPTLYPSASGRLSTALPLEAFAAGPALAARLQSVKTEFLGDAADVIRFAEEGDTTARDTVVSAGRAVGAAIAQLINVLDPEAVIMGGGLGMVGGVYRQSIEKAIRECVWADLHRQVPVLSAQLGLNAGIIGAAYQAAANLSNSHDP
jgi:glucokinase